MTIMAMDVTPAAGVARKQAKAAKATTKPKSSRRKRDGGRIWAYAGSGIAATISIWANISWAVSHNGHDPVAITIAAIWPCIFLLALEINWRSLMRPIFRWVGLTPIAAVAGVISYEHVRQLLIAQGYSQLTATLGPIAIDGLMVVAAGSLLGGGSPGRATTPTSTPPPEKPVAYTPPVALPAVTDTASDPAAAMAADLSARGVKRADALRQIMAATGVSQRTAERRWKAATS